jgi:carbon storage regulator
METMLVLSRRVGERTLIDGRIVVTVARVKNNRVRIAIEAPPQVGIHRGESPPPLGAAMRPAEELSAV